MAHVHASAVVVVAAFRGREAEATEVIQATMDGVASRGEGRGVTSQYAAAEAQSVCLLPTRGRRKSNQQG